MTFCYLIMFKNISLDLVQSGRICPANLGVQSCLVRNLICPDWLSPSIQLESIYQSRLGNNLLQNTANQAFKATTLWNLDNSQWNWTQFWRLISMGGRSSLTKIWYCIQIWRSLWLGKEEKRNRGASQNKRATVCINKEFDPIVNVSIYSFNWVTCYKWTYLKEIFIFC